MTGDRVLLLLISSVVCTGVYLQVAQFTEWLVRVTGGKRLVHPRTAGTWWPFWLPFYVLLMIVAFVWWLSVNIRRLMRG